MDYESTILFLIQLFEEDEMQHTLYTIVANFDNDLILRIVKSLFFG